MPRKRKLILVVASLLAVSVLTAVLATAHNQPRTPLAAEHTLSVPIVGRIASLLVKDGEFVQKGQVIARLDSTSYETDLKKAEAALANLQAQSQSAIKPMDAIPGITGILPRQLPREEPPLRSMGAPAHENLPKPLANKPAPTPDPYKAASQKQQQAKTAMDEATKSLAKLTAQVADAQEARDSLRPRVTLADVTATQAAKKAANAQELLDAGVISRKRGDELLADRDATQKALDAVKAQAADADKTLDDAKAAALAAQTAIDKATSELQQANDRLAKAAALPIPKAPPAKPTKSQPTETRVVMRRMPLTVRTEHAPAIPVKVLVDEQAMQSSEAQIEVLQKRIAELKSRIADCAVLAPISGRVQISVAGDISILL